MAPTPALTRSRIIIGITTLALGLGAFLHGQTTQPADARRLEQTAKEFGMTPEQLDRFVREKLGDPIVVDGDLIVGVRNDANGHVSSVQVTTPARSVRFNRAPDAKNPGLRYSRADLTDIPKLPNILLRVGADFVQAKAVGEGKMQTTDGRTFSFDASQHEWIASK
jgi:hypothetical protein